MACDRNLATKTDRYGQSLPTEEFRQAWIAGGGKTPTQSPTVKSKPLSDELVTLWKMETKLGQLHLGGLHLATYLYAQLCCVHHQNFPPAKSPPPSLPTHTPAPLKGSYANSARISRRG